MADPTAMELEARELTATLPTSQLDEVRRFFTGALFTAVLAAVGTVLVTVALTVVVVGAPVFAALIAYVVVRHVKESAAASRLVDPVSP